MDLQTAKVFDRREDQKTGELIKKIFSLPADERSYENAVRTLFPEIPWTGKTEERGHLLPITIPPWLVLPFYEKPILVMYPLEEKQFRMVYGLTSEDLLELLNKRRVYATTRFGCDEFVGDKFSHLDRVLEKELPHARWIS